MVTQRKSQDLARAFICSHLFSRRIAGLTSETDKRIKLLNNFKIKTEIEKFDNPGSTVQQVQHYN